MNCIAIYITRSTPCNACNNIQPVNNEEECKMTTLVSIFQTKLVLQMMIKTDQPKRKNFTSFNDAIQRFFTLKCPTPMSELKENEVKNLFLTTGQMRMIA